MEPETLTPTWYVIDSQRRVWANTTTKAGAKKARTEIRKSLRNVPHAPDPNTLKIVEWDQLKRSSMPLDISSMNGDNVIHEDQRDRQTAT